MGRQNQSHSASFMYSDMPKPNTMLAISNTTKALTSLLNTVRSQLVEFAVILRELFFR